MRWTLKIIIQKPVLVTVTCYYHIYQVLKDLHDGILGHFKRQHRGKISLPWSWGNLWCYITVISSKALKGHTSLFLTRRSTCACHACRWVNNIHPGDWRMNLVTPSNDTDRLCLLYLGLWIQFLQKARVESILTNVRKYNSRNSVVICEFGKATKLIQLGDQYWEGKSHGSKQQTRQSRDLYQ